MIELRWVTYGQNKQLEYRILAFGIDASGALTPGGGWSNWIQVKTVTVDEASYEDLRASGGIVGAP